MTQNYVTPTQNYITPTQNYSNPNQNLQYPTYRSAQFVQPVLYFFVAHKLNVRDGDREGNVEESAVHVSLQ